MENKIKENSKTNCPKCGKKKPFKFVGWCLDCTYPSVPFENDNDNYGITPGDS
jgi:hypothetical protein